MSGAPPPSRQQIRGRQAILAIGAILMLVLIVIAFRGCLNARKDRSFQNYVSDLSSITTETTQLSDNFFKVLSGDSGTSSDIGLQQTIDGDTGTSQGLLDRAQDLSAPDEIGAAQEQIVLSFELRHDAIEGIAAQVPKLSGTQKADAEDAIYTQMKVLSASDILYARAKDQIEQALTDQEVVVPDGVPTSQFLPTPGENGQPNYLDPAAVASAFSGAAGGSTAVSNADCQKDGETHGLGLVDGGSTLQPSGTPLANGGAVTAPAGDDSIDVAVQNQGSADESGIQVNVTSEDGSVDATETINSIAANATETVSVPLQPVPKAGDSITLNVDVTPVGCEQVEENNSASFPITF